MAGNPYRDSKGRFSSRGGGGRKLGHSIKRKGYRTARGRGNYSHMAIRATGYKRRRSMSFAKFRRLPAKTRYYD